jgi:Xaa-Pro aminopeptidase
VTENLVDIVWGDAKPSRPQEKVMVLDTKYSGKKFEEKLEDLRKELDKKKSAGIVICKIMPFGNILEFLLMYLAMLDEVAWLFNLRGNEYGYLYKTINARKADSK